MTIGVQTCFLTISIHNKLYGQVVIPMESQQYTKFMLYCKKKIQYKYWSTVSFFLLIRWHTSVFLSFCVCTTNLHQLGMKNAAVTTSSFFAPGYNPAICTQRSEGAKRGLFEGGRDSNPSETAGFLGYPIRPSFCKTPEDGCKIDPGRRIPDVSLVKNGLQYLAFQVPMCFFHGQILLFQIPVALQRFQVLSIE